MSTSPELEGTGLADSPGAVLLEMSQLLSEKAQSLTTSKSKKKRTIVSSEEEVEGKQHIHRSDGSI